MATEVLGLYDTRSAADLAATALAGAGFSRSDISVESYDGTARGDEANVGQRAEGGWDKMLEKLHLMAPKSDANYYSQGLRQGQTLVTVSTNTDAEADRAADILDQHGALDIDDHSTQYHAAQGTASGVGMADSTVIPVVEEELAVGKRQVRGGGVRVYQQVTERPVEEQVTLHDERVTVDRRPVDRAATDADYQSRDFTVTETSEQAVVAKNTRVVEEVVVGKTATDRTETVRDTVKRTNVQVDEMDGTDDLDDAVIGTTDGRGVTR